MNPLAILSVVFATACAAPSNVPTIGGAAAPEAAAAYAAVPAPYTTSEVQGAPIVTVHQPPAHITKQLHYADRTYVAGYSTEILKPPTPDFKIDVSTVLKGTQRVNPPIVTVRKEPHVVNSPYVVEKPYSVPYEVVRNVEKIVEVPTPVHVANPYYVPEPIAVRGQDIVKLTRTVPIVHHHHLSSAVPAASAHYY